eukprot:COSAG02_NODE_1962_length_10253_cov_6.942294_2_plen_121_part_00
MITNGDYCAAQYANAADVIVSRHKFARAEGLLSWGRAGGGHVYAPNMRVQFVDNVIEEGNHMWNWNATYPYVFLMLYSENRGFFCDVFVMFFRMLYLGTHTLKRWSRTRLPLCGLCQMFY